MNRRTMVFPHRSKEEEIMCHGEEWELLKMAYAEMARRTQEKAQAERRSSTTTPPKPVETPVKNEEPVPV